MMAKNLFLAVLFPFLLFCEAKPNYDKKLSEFFFDGGFVFFPIKRARLQQRLDEINEEFDNEINKLYLPSEPILQPTIRRDEHVIIVAFGSIDVAAFDQVLTDEEKQTQSTVIEGLTIAVPYLTTQNGDTKTITFQMKHFISDFVPHIESNAVSTPIVAKNLVRQQPYEGTVDITFEYYNLRLRLAGFGNGPCVPHGETAVGDMLAYDHELQISKDGPEFSVCDYFPDLDVNFCDIYRDPSFHSVLAQAGDNVCQYWVPTANVQTCRSTFGVMDMSDAMRQLLLLDEEPAFADGVMQIGTFDIRLVFPCVE